MRIATDSEPVHGDIEDIGDIDEAGVVDSDADDADDACAPRCKAATSAPRRAMLFGLAAVVGLAVVIGWLGFRAHQSHQAQAERSQLVQAARQGALNLTTIDWQHADGDAQRILESATGSFYDDFAKRSQPFIEVVKQAQSKTVGAVTEAGLESATGSEAQVLVALSVTTSNASAPDQPPRLWRMRISVQKVDDQMKISNVEFVP